MERGKCRKKASKGIAKKAIEGIGGILLRRYENEVKSIFGEKRSKCVISNCNECYRGEGYMDG